MHKTRTALAALAAFAFVPLAASFPAQAREDAFPVGLFGGHAAATPVGPAIAGQHHDSGHEGPTPIYTFYPPHPPFYGPDCYWQRRWRWNGYRWLMRRARVCD